MAARQCKLHLEERNTTKAGQKTNINAVSEQKDETTNTEKLNAQGTICRKTTRRDPWNRLRASLVLGQELKEPETIAQGHTNQR